MSEPGVSLSEVEFDLRKRPFRRWLVVAKTLQDYSIVVLASFLLAPIFLIIVIAIRVDSSGPVMFRQVRYGLNKKLITVFKFRTMYNEFTDSSADVLVSRNDPRVTRVGAFLRRTSLDELPQIYNIIRGEMSVVGPRPHAIGAKAAGRPYVDVAPNYDLRYQMKPGITGWAQINGWRGETSSYQAIVKRVDYDLEYINRWSLWLDLVILARTLPAIWSGKNAY